MPFDDWLHQLNQTLRRASHDIIVKKSGDDRNKEEIKRFGRLFEDLMVLL